MYLLPKCLPVNLLLLQSMYFFPDYPFQYWKFKVENCPRQKVANYRHRTLRGSVPSPNSHSPSPLPTEIAILTHNYRQNQQTLGVRRQLPTKTADIVCTASALSINQYTR